MERTQCTGHRRKQGEGQDKLWGGRVPTREGGIVIQNLDKARAQEWGNKTETLILESGNRGRHQNQGQGKRLVLELETESDIPGAGLSITAEPAGRGRRVRKPNGIQTRGGGANPS